MSALRIDSSDGQRAYQPGETISGRVTWQVDEPPQSAELRLFWYTSKRAPRTSGTSTRWSSRRRR